MYTKDSGKMTKRMVKENTFMQKVQLTEAVGTKISSRAKVEKTGPMALSITESTLEAKSTEEESFSGQTAPSTKVNGRTTKCMGKVNSSGPTVEYTKGTTKMIKSMVKVFILGQTAECTRAGFIMANSMEKGFSDKLMAKRYTAYGRRVRKAKYAKHMTNFKPWKMMFD